MSTLHEMAWQVVRRKRLTVAPAEEGFEVTGEGQSGAADSPEEAVALWVMRDYLWGLDAPAAMQVSVPPVEENRTFTPNSGGGTFQVTVNGKPVPVIQEQPADPTPEWHTTRDIAELVNRSQAAIHLWVKERRVNVHLLRGAGRQEYRFTHEEYERIRAMKEAGTLPPAIGSAGGVVSVEEREARWMNGRRKRIESVPVAAQKPAPEPEPATEPAPEPEPEPASTPATVIAAGSIDTLTPQEAADILGIPVQGVHRLIRDRRLTPLTQLYPTSPVLLRRDHVERLKASGEDLTAPADEPKPGRSHKYGDLYKEMDVEQQARLWAEELQADAAFLSGMQRSTKYPICPQDARRFAARVKERLGSRVVVEIAPHGQYHRFTARYLREKAA